MSVDFVRGKWRVRISVNRRRLELGRFNEEADAREAYHTALAAHAVERVRRPRPAADPRERFAAKCSPAPSGCILWQGAKDKDGYGKFQLNAEGKQQHVRAHRYAFFVALGHWPGEFALHSCDTPACVNPEHLEDGDQRKNVRDCVARGRHRSGHVGRRRCA